MGLAPGTWALTVLAAVALSRLGVPLRRLGFGPPYAPARLLGLAALQVAAAQLAARMLVPVWGQLFGSGRDLARFADVAGSPGALVSLLALSWTVAAFGEEIAFRIVLFRGLAFAMGDSRAAYGTALLLQAVVFGLVHAYQGPAGVAGSATSGLIYGALTQAVRGSIWPAALSHGINNTLGIIAMYDGAVP